MGGYILAFGLGVIVGEIAFVIAIGLTNANKIEEDNGKTE